MMDIEIELHQEMEQAIRNAPFDPEKAAHVLRLAIPILRKLDHGFELPNGLGRYLADAFEVAMAKPVAYRATQLSRELHLSAENRRPYNFQSIGWEVDHIMYEERISLNQASKKISKARGISVSTCKRSYQKYLQSELEAWEKSKNWYEGISD